MSAPADTPPERTALYRLYDTGERLLYVGITSRVKARMAAHAADKSWWSDVATREIEWFDNRPQAVEAERVAIRTEGPLHNHSHKPSPILALLPPPKEENLRAQRKPVVRDERPAHQRVAADVRALIMSGDVAIGGKLPSTGDFVDRYAISNVTVQHSLRLLKDEGFAVGRAGSGVYVTSPTPAHLNDVQAYSVELRTSGECKPPMRVAEALGLGADELAWGEHYLTSADGWPLEAMAIYRRTEQNATKAVSFVDRITARLPTSEELVRLQLPEDVPLMCVFRTLLDAAGGTAEVRIILKPGHLHQIECQAVDQV